MKLAVIADTHFSLRETYGGKTALGLPVRLEDKLRIFKDVVRGLNIAKVEVLVLAGDVFHSYKVSETLKTLFYEALEPFNGQIILMPGNHDYAAGGVHSFSVESSLDSLKGLKGERVLVADSSGVYLEEQVLLLPWLGREVVKKAISEGYGGQKKLMIGHFAICGAELGSFKPSFIDEVTKDSLESVAEFTLCGHIHKRQVQRNSSGRGWGYVGSLYTNDFGEEGFETGFAIVDLDKQVSEEGFLKFVNVKDRQFKTVVIRAGGDPLFLEDEITAGFEQFEEGAIVRVRICGSREDVCLTNRDRIRNAFRAKALSVTFCYDYVEVGKEKIDIGNVERLRLDVAFRQYCKMKSVSEDVVELGVKFL